MTDFDALFEQGRSAGHPMLRGINEEAEAQFAQMEPPEAPEPELGAPVESTFWKAVTSAIQETALPASGPLSDDDIAQAERLEVNVEVPLAVERVELSVTVPADGWTEAYLSGGGGANLPEEEKEQVRRGLKKEAHRTLMSSAKQDWGSPQAFYDRLDAEFGFELDVCAHEKNFKHPNYITEEMDTFETEWLNEKGEPAVCWMNPPYGRETPRFMHLAYERSLAGCTVVCLVAARVGTDWWKKYVHGCADEIRLVDGRLKFEDEFRVADDDSATFDSAVVIYRPPYGRRHSHYTRMER